MSFETKLEEDSKMSCPGGGVAIPAGVQGKT